ncbi:MAG TPA: PEGA domain-containing protein, partial [Vicinamibacteria bacterium]|nr:PEGA domain-containing protein [Vicinamibacteria bacterium]
HFGYGFGPFGAFYGWGPYAFGYGPYAFARHGFAPYGFYGRVHDEASARVQVTPKQTEVYVDGYLAGVADDFDGTFQRLHLRPGGHEITLYLDGHRPVIQRLYFTPGKTQKIKLAMVPLAPGEGPVARPEPRRTPRRPRPRVET